MSRAVLEAMNVAELEPVALPRAPVRRGVEGSNRPQDDVSPTWAEIGGPDVHAVDGLEAYLDLLETMASELVDGDADRTRSLVRAGAVGLVRAGDERGSSVTDPVVFEANARSWIMCAM